jgi:hypothetical protein
LSLGRPETAGGGRRGPLREGAEGAGPRLLGGNGAGLHGGEDWAWVGSEGGRSFRALRGWVGAASGPRQVQRAGAAGLAVARRPRLSEARTFPARHRLLRRRPGATQVGPAGDGQRAPRARRPGRAGGGARPGAGRSGWGRAGAARMLLRLWKREVGNHCPPPGPGPSCLLIFALF